MLEFDLIECNGSSLNMVCADTLKRSFISFYMHAKEAPLVKGNIGLDEKKVTCALALISSGDERELFVQHDECVLRDFVELLPSVSTDGLFFPKIRPIKNVTTPSRAG